jgi:hypothetical protein
MSRCAAVAHKLRIVATAALGSVLVACGGIQIRPDPVLPTALVTPMPARVGLLVTDEMRNFVHKETRWGVEWSINLGPGHLALSRRLFGQEFAQVAEFSELEQARGDPGLKAIFEPRIDQYSFATARETGGRYYAVTIRYRINLFTPQGAAVDTYTLTGYGTALARGMSSGAPLQLATLAAMRDAAAKFLVQFPDQPAGKQLAQSQAVTQERSASAGSGDSNMQIEAVPIEEPQPEPVKPEPPAAVPETAKAQLR